MMMKIYREIENVLSIWKEGCGCSCCCGEDDESIQKQNMKHIIIEEKKMMKIREIVSCLDGVLSCFTFLVFSYTNSNLNQMNEGFI